MASPLRHLQFALAWWIAITPGVLLAGPSQEPASQVPAALELTGERPSSAADAVPIPESKPAATIARPLIVPAPAPFEVPRSFTIGEVTVLVFHEQVVKLRFALLADAPRGLPEPFPSTPPLVKVGIDLFTSPKR